MPKTFVVLGTVTLGFLTQSAVAKDTPEDAQLREALRGKMTEMNQPAAAPVAPVVPVVPVAPVAPVPPAAPAPATAATRPPPTVVIEPTPAPAPAVSPAAVVSVAPVMQDNPETAKMREVLRARIAQEGPYQEPVAVAPAPKPPKVEKPAVKEPEPPAAAAVEPTPPKEPEPVQLQAPPVPIAATKEQRLQELLQRYKADQISPQQYHTERAKIIAE